MDIEEFRKKLKKLLLKYNIYTIFESKNDVIFLLVVNELTSNKISFSIFGKKSNDNELLRININFDTNKADVCSNNFGHGYSWFTHKFSNEKELLNDIENELIQLT